MKSKKENSIKSVEKSLIDIAIKIAKQEKGCLFVIQRDGIAYETLIPQDVQPFNILENQRRIETLEILKV